MLLDIDGRYYQLVTQSKMEGASANPIFNFAVEIPIRRPRPWERAARASHATRHRGRKVWKRYELRHSDAPPSMVDSKSQHTSENTETVAGTPNQRPVKRLRNVPGSGKEGAPDATQYIATLREKSSGTPKSRPIYLTVNK